MLEIVNEEQSTIEAFNNSPFLTGAFRPDFK